MEWGKLYANLPDDVRVQAAEAAAPGAAWLLVESMCYCTRAESDGLVPHTQVERFGGGSKRRQRVAALVAEGLWVSVAAGYLLDPMLWSEERNLSDSAERKKKADRERIAARRELERLAREAEPVAEVSRDSSATCSATPETAKAATCSSDSRALEERRQEKRDKSVVGYLPVASGRGADDDDIGELESAVIAAFAEKDGPVITAARARAVAAKVLDRATAKGLTVHHPPRYVAAAIRNEPDPFASLLLDEAPPLHEILAVPADGHAYAHDPETRLCRDCSAPEVDRIHRRRTA